MRLVFSKPANIIMVIILFCLLMALATFFWFEVSIDRLDEGIKNLNK